MVEMAVAVATMRSWSSRIFVRFGTISCRIVTISSELVWTRKSTFCADPLVSREPFSRLTVCETSWEKPSGFVVRMAVSNRVKTSYKL